MASRSNPGKASPRLIASALAVCTIVHFGLIAHRLHLETPTVDEVAHLPAGLTYWQQGTFKLYRHNPPLARLAAALPVLWNPPRLLYEGTWKNHEPANHWLFAFMTLTANNDNPADQQRYLSAFTKGRLVMAVWSSLTVLALFAWGAWWFGASCGLLAAFLYATSPSILSHASYVTTDLAATSTSLVASFLFARWLDAPSSHRLLLGGLGLGVAQLAKFSNLWLYGLFIPWSVWNKDSHSKIGTSLIDLAKLFAVSILVINVGYLFEGTLTPLGRFPFVSDLLTRPRLASDGPPTSDDLGSSRTYNEVLAVRINRFAGTPFAWLPCPLPFHYVAGFDEQKFEADGKYPMYLNGTFASDHSAPGSKERRGWWYYYLVAIYAKDPFPGDAALVGLAGIMAIALSWRNLKAEKSFTRTADHCFRRDRLLPVVTLALVPIAAISLLTDINLGLRYILPSLPFLSLLVAAFATWLPSPAKTVSCFFLIVWRISILAWVHPHELSYFNPWVGGPTRGRFMLIDSNIDWGQDLRKLARWLDDHPDWASTVRLAYFGTIPPEFEGMRYRLPPRDLRQIPPALRTPRELEGDPWANGPIPGRFAVSVNFERGLPFHQPCPLDQLTTVMRESPRALLPGSTMLTRVPHPYTYFQRFTPRIEKSIGHSILLYEITREQADEARNAMGLAPLSGVEQI